MKSPQWRWRWLNLGILGLCALLSAQIINNVMASEIISLPVESGAEEISPAQPSAAQGHGASDISARNLFNAHPPEPLKPDDGAPLGDVEPGELPGPHGDCEAAEGLALMATMVMESPTESLAILQAGPKDEHLLKAGDVVGDVTLAAVYRERAVILEGGRYRCLSLGAPPQRASVKKPRPGPKPRGNAAEWARIQAGIEDLGGGRKRVSKGMLDWQLEHLDKLAQQAQARPYIKNGKQVGFLISKLRSHSLYTALSLKVGDALMSVNGEEMTSPNKALRLLDQLGSAKDVVVTIERGGQLVTMEFNIR